MPAHRAPVTSRPPPTSGQRDGISRRRFRGHLGVQNLDEVRTMPGVTDAVEMASWDDYFYSRQWNTPPEMTVAVAHRRSRHDVLRASHACW